MLRPICVRCKIEMRVVQNGVYVTLMAHDPPQPYKSYSTDKYRCPLCKNEVCVTGDLTQPFWREGDHLPALDNALPVYEHVKDAMAAWEEENEVCD